MKKYQIIMGVLAFFLSPCVSAVENGRFIENYIATVKAFEEIPDAKEIQLAEGEQLRDVVAFALNNVTKNNLVPVTIDPKTAVGLLRPEFKAFLGFWCWLPVVPKTKEERVQLRKVRKLLSTNAYEIGLAVLTVEGASITSGPAVYGATFAKQMLGPVNALGISTVFGDTKTQSEKFLKYQPVYQEHIGYYQRLDGALLKHEVSYQELINFELIRRYVK